MIVLGMNWRAGGSRQVGVKQGMAKDLALQRAQLKLTQESANPELGHPFFWGSNTVKKRCHL